MNYGVANTLGRISENKVVSILEHSKKLGINMLDTAINYGNSETLIGKFGIEGWNAITKLPPIPYKCKNIEDWVINQLSESLDRLRIKKLYGLLLHQPDQLLGPEGLILYETLINLKKDRKVEKIGLSIYNPKSLDHLLNLYDFDIIQAPINIFDRTLECLGYVKLLKEKKIEIHARSVFLQGLLLMPPNKRPKKFSKWQSSFQKFDKWLQNKNLTPLEATINYVNSLDFVDKIVIGFDSKEQLTQAFLSIKTNFINPPSFFKDNDRRMIDPSSWMNL